MYKSVPNIDGKCTNLYIKFSELLRAKIPLTVYLWFKEELDPYISKQTIEKIMKQIEDLEK
jgi:hypothetical protein